MCISNDGNSSGTAQNLLAPHAKGSEMKILSDDQHLGAAGVSQVKMSENYGLIWCVVNDRMTHSSNPPPPQLVSRELTWMGIYVNVNLRECQRLGLGWRRGGLAGAGLRAVLHCCNITHVRYKECIYCCLYLFVFFNFIYTRPIGLSELAHTHRHS